MFKGFTLKRLAFTMLELVFVIVIIGIISAMVIPRMNRDTLFEATNQTLNHIKYTQHLAMTQDVYSDTDPTWFQLRWTMQFYACGGYAIYSDTNKGGGPDRIEAAIDPHTGKTLFTSNTCTENVADFNKVSLARHYGVTGLAAGANCGGLDLAFDTLGRPYSTGGVNGVLKQNCDITITTSTGSEVIRVHPETGYACILDAGGICI